jgi:hypothetical protein
MSKFIFECPFSYQMVTEDEENVDGLTREGRFAVLYNIHMAITTDFESLQLSMVEEDSRAFVYNSQIFRVTTALQCLLDAITCYCHDFYGSSHVTGDKLYFHSYKFHQPDLQQVRILQTKIADLQYKSLSFNAFANRVKHQMPWVGLRKTDPEGMVDVYDDEGHGIVYGMLNTVHKACCGILKNIKPS